MIEKKLNSTYYIFRTVERLRNINREMANLEEERKGLVDEIKAFMEEEKADALMDPDGKMLIGILQERGGLPKFDTIKFKEEQPELYQKYQKAMQPFKVFLAK